MLLGDVRTAPPDGEGGRKMRMRRLGRTGLQVSEVGLGGAWLLGRHSDLPLEAGMAPV